MYINGYRCMWVVAMFDLPTETKEDKRQYVRFAKHLARDGFSRLQYSIYGRHCASKENAEVHVGRIERNLPLKGEVRILTITDKQFERMIVFWGKMPKPPEAAPCQMSLF